MSDTLEELLKHNILNLPQSLKSSLAHFTPILILLFKIRVPFLAFDLIVSRKPVDSLIKVCSSVQIALFDSLVLAIAFVYLSCAISNPPTMPQQTFNFRKPCIKKSINPK